MSTFRYLTAIIFLTFISNSLLAQKNHNIDLIGQVQTSNSATDIWGYVDDSGIEYAIVGTQKGVEIFSLENPSKPTLIKKIEGQKTKWRDIKSYKNRIYVTSDRTYEGLLIIDMTNISNISSKYLPSESHHNLYIDTSIGYMYLAGNVGVQIYNLNIDLDNPKYISTVPNVHYSHDAFVRDGLLFTSEIYEGHFGIYDVSNPTSIKMLTRMNTSRNFSHNAWSDDTNNYLFTTDEKEDAWVEAFYITDVSSPIRVDRFKPNGTINSGVVPHNTHYKDGYLYTSWYTEGVIITDVSEPENMIQVGNYDTYLDNEKGFNGCWGVYPFLPSGLILASDRSKGLFVLKPNLVKPSKLKGLVRDFATKKNINGAKIEFVNENQNPKTTNAQGEYKTGIDKSGEVKIRVSHPFYETKTFTVNLTRDKYQNLDVELEPKKIVVYPNPVTEVLYIIDEYSEFATETMIYSAASGDMVYKGVKKKEIDVSHLAPGAYFVHLVVNEQKKYIVKIIKN